VGGILYPKWKDLHECDNRKCRDPESSQEGGSGVTQLPSEECLHILNVEEMAMVKGDNSVMNADADALVHTDDEIDHENNEDADETDVR
jgi:hypothetical protein